MNNHFCVTKSITDLLACTDCGVNQICCKECFHIKHRDQHNAVHKSQKLVDSDLYKTFLKIIHLEWLVGQKLQKSFGSFEIADQGVKTYMINCAFYGSEFYKELIPDEVTQQQYIVLKQYYSGNPKSFDTLSGLEKILNEAKTQDIIKKHTAKLTQLTEEEQIMNSHIDFYIGADIYYLSEFFAYEQTNFAQYLAQLDKNGGFSIYKYIEWREKTSNKERNPTYYSNEFTAFLVEYYRKDSADKQLFTIQEYILSFWQYFHVAVQLNPTLRQFLESEFAFYKQYQQLMTEKSLSITYLGFKIWKLSNGVSKQLPYLKNHYFLFAFVQGYIKMLIQRTYTFLSSEEKEQNSKETWLDFLKFIKDCSQLYQERNASLPKQQEKKIFDFDTYRKYYSYRRRMEAFHNALKSSKDNIYDKEIAMKFFNHYFEKQIQLNHKLYKAFFEKHQQQVKEKKEEEQKQAEKLKEELKLEEKDEFYEFVFINFVNQCRENELKLKKETYKAYKQGVLETMDQEYIKVTEEKFKRGDYIEEVQVVEEAEQVQEEPKVKITETGVKIVEGIDKFEEQIFEDNLNEQQESQGEDQFCPCCHGQYICQNLDCQVIGYCTLCSENY